MATKKELLNIKGITDAKLEKIIDVVGKIESVGFMTGNEIRAKRKTILKITTGSKKLDALLGGGIESMSLTEVFGEFRTGKTQLAHTLCVTAQLPKEMGGGCGKVAYIDTEGTFRPDRIAKIAERFELDPYAVLDNVTYARAYTCEHFNILLMALAGKMMEDTYALLVVDSIIAIFRSDFSGRGELSERQQLMGKILNKLIKIGDQFNVAVFMTNQVMADPSGAVMPGADPRKPVGGNILAHASTTRLYFKKGKGDLRVCRVYDSPCLPEKDETFMLTDYGVQDPAD